MKSLYKNFTHPELYHLIFNEATTFREMLRPSLPIKYTCSWWRLWTLNRQAKILLYKIFEIRIFSDSLNFFHSYLIYFYTHGITFPENTPRPNILAHLKRLLKDVSPWTYIRDFVVPYYNHCVDSTNLSFYETCNLKKVAIWRKDIFHIFSEELFTDKCGRLLSWISFHILRNSRLLKDFPKNFAKLTRKHLCRSLFFNKAAGLQLY